MAANNEHYKALSLMGTWGVEASETLKTTSEDGVEAYVKQFPDGEVRAKIVMSLIAKIQPLAGNYQFNGEIPFGD
jgi:hypothetical protein